MKRRTNRMLNETMIDIAMEVGCAIGDGRIEPVEDSRQLNMDIETWAEEFESAYGNKLESYGYLEELDAFVADVVLPELGACDVVIQVRGGVAEVKTNPGKVRVRIVDYDNEENSDE